MKSRIWNMAQAVLTEYDSCCEEAGRFAICQRGSPNALRHYSVPWERREDGDLAVSCQVSAECVRIWMNV